MTSLWLDHPTPIATDEFQADASFDEIIVGGGITGLVAAALFARAGRRVAVVEARSVGHGTTGHTTAKVSQLQGTHFTAVRSHSYPSLLRAYADGQREAFTWLVDYAEQRGVHLERRDAFTYAGTPAGIARVDHEYTLARSVGLAVRRLPEAPLPFRTFAAVEMADQAQLNPLELLAALADDIRLMGGVIFEGARVTAVTASSPARVTTSRGHLSADHVILATGAPILDRGLYFAKVVAQRSYAQAFTVPHGSLPNGMFLNVDEPTRSIRTSGPLLLTGGNGHGVGREASPRARADDLTEWTITHWPGAELTHSWSAQDYSPAHHVPFVGWLPRGRGRIFLATGYDKWGMTNGVAAALTLVADIMGTNTAWQKSLHHRITMPRAIGAGIGGNAAVAWWYARGYATAFARKLPAQLPARLPAQLPARLPAENPRQLPSEGSGRVGRVGFRPTAESTVDGRTCALSAVCSHLGAVVTWNDLEKSWDCPAHGSRFSSDGTVLEGPATRDLRRQPVPSEG